MEADFSNYRSHYHHGEYQTAPRGRTATPLPDTDEGRRLRAIGYETFEDADMRLDIVPVEWLSSDLSPHYRAVNKYFASTPRYALVCPHCGNIWGREKESRAFLGHMAKNGTGCAHSMTKIKPLNTKGRDTAAFNQ